MKNKIAALFIIVFTLFAIFPISGFAQNVPQDMKKANQLIDKSISALNKGDIKDAQKQYNNFNSTWLSIEDGIKTTSIEAYRDVEDKMGMVQFAFARQPADKNEIKKALIELNNTNNTFIEGKFSSSPKNQGKEGRTGNVAELVTLLNHSLSNINNNDMEAARRDMETFRKSWLNVEGVVLTQSSKVYADAEKDMVASYAMLSSKPADIEGAKKTIVNMRNYLSPLTAKTSYTMLDATTILLREGLEGLLVVVALLGFLKKAGHEEKSKWIWFGVGAGMAVSILLGVLVNMLFSAGTFGSNNFLISGWTGVFAAVMLLYMSYWLHSKSSVAEWQRYIRVKSTKALDAGSLFSLAVLSFLAVFREGTETVLFFIGMAASIKLSSLLMGIALGLVILIAVSYLILKVGLKIPMRPFFLVSSILMFYLCIKFTGMGIHGLQLSGLLPATQAPFPASDFFGIYSTWESLAPQAFLIVIALIAALWNQKKDRKMNMQHGGKLHDIS